MPRRFSAMTANLMERVNDLEKRLNKCCDSIEKNDGVIQDQVSKQLLPTSRYYISIFFFHFTLYKPLPAAPLTYLLR